MKTLINFFQKGLRKTAVSVSRKITGCFSGVEEWGENDYETLEAALIGADFGVPISLRIVNKIKEEYKLGKVKTEEDIFSVAKKEVTDILKHSGNSKDETKTGLKVILLVGVNGSGKTTTAGKMAHLLKGKNKKIMLAAGDTFRAAALEQLKLWGERTGVHVVAAKSGADPASVAFDAVNAAKARNYDYLIIDTAGRQHTKKALMDELNKIVRTVEKLHNGFFERIIVVDGSIGGNALSQVREFSHICALTGVICTKLDGSYKGGMVVAIKNEFQLPILYVGLGESENDLIEFNPELFAKAIFEKIQD